MTAPPPVRRIADLPFVERPPLELLGFADDRDTVDLEYTGFGWARVERVWLGSGEAAAGDAPVAVDDPLILALHAEDDSEPLADDIELTFALDDQTVTVLLSAFLERWLPLLPAAPAIVLALCNPHGARLPRVAAAGARPVHHAIGPVDAWVDTDRDGSRLRLAAEHWRDANGADDADTDADRRDVNADVNAATDADRRDVNANAMADADPDRRAAHPEEPA